MKKIKVSLGRKRSYDIIIGYNIIPRIGGILKKLRLGEDAIVITTRSICRLGYTRPLLRALRSAGHTPYIIKVPGGEACKTFCWVVRVIEKIVKIDTGRGSFILVLGGGTTGDLGGYVASAYKRGIPYVQIPTTLLAQVDSGIGGKTAVDIIAGKNLIGAFYQPKLVVSDIHFLEGLPKRIFKSALGEIIKYGVIADKELFFFLERNISKIVQERCRQMLEYIIYRSSRIKARIVQEDENDKKGVRARLNFGHTIGHAVETASEYSKLKFYYHGEAVGIGMIAAARIASEIGLLNHLPLSRITNLIKRAGLPVSISGKIEISKIMKALKHDKKIVHGVNRFVLPATIGKVRIVEDIPRKLIERVLKTMQKGG